MSNARTVGVPCADNDIEIEVERVIHPSRHVWSACCFIAILILSLTWGFPDRGVVFAPDASAKTDRTGTYNLRKGRVLTKAIGHVRTHYVDRSRIRLGDMAVKAIQAIQRSVPEVMVRIENSSAGEPEKFVISVADKSRDFSLAKVSDLYELNWKLMDVYDFLAAHLPASSDLENIEYASINGALATLDPHSILLSPRMFREMQVGTKGRFGGLGIVISIRDGFLTVMSVMSSTPADRAGVKSGDRIVQIGEESTVNMPLNDAVSRLRGKPGSSVTIWVRRKGETNLRSFPIVREEIQIRSVEHRALSHGIGYVKIRNFQSNTTRDLKQALLELDKEKSLEGLVLDLRENPGGLLDQAIEVSDVFLSKGNIVTTVKEGAQEREERHATKDGTLEDLPLVVLINRGSASASEIVAGAIKHNNRGTVMGSVSYGKGSVQVLYRLDDAALKLTIAQYLTPGDISIQSVGIVPDVEILPIFVKKDALGLHSGEASQRGEENLKSHLTSAKTKRTKSDTQLKLLHRTEDAESDGPDQLALLAQNFLRTARSTDRRKALIQASTMLGERARKEDAAITKKLGELGVDWTSGTNASKPDLEAKLTFDGSSGPIQAGSKHTLVGEVTNISNRPIFRVHGVVTSAMRFVDGSEFVFGKLEPGETRKWSTEVTIPDSQHSASDRIVLDLFSDEKPLAMNASLRAEVKGHDLPLFGYMAQVIDGKSIGGNDNGLIQRGETIDLAVTVFNQGKGDAKDVMATIKNESGEFVFIEQGRSVLGPMKRGESKQALFKLKVKAPLKERHVRLTMSIIDQKLRTWAHDELNLPVFPSEFSGGNAKSGWVVIGEQGARLKSGAHRDTANLNDLPPGLALRVLRETQDYVEVRSQPSKGILEQRGWIPKSRVSWLKTAPDMPGSWSPEPTYQAPNIEVDSTPSMASTKESLTLRGKAMFDHDSPRKNRSFYVFRGDDKVFFKSGVADSAVIDFEAKIPLNKGSNDLVLVARESDSHVTRRYITVFRN